MADVETYGETSLPSRAVFLYIGFTATLDEPPCVLITFARRTADGEYAPGVAVVLTIPEAKEALAAFRRTLREAKGG